MAIARARMRGSASFFMARPYACAARAVKPPRGRSSRGAAGRRDQPHVCAADHQERLAARLRGAVERLDAGVADREELAVALVHVVREPAAVALARQRESPRDPVAVGLQHNLFLAQVQGRRIVAAGLGSRLAPWYLTFT